MITPETLATIRVLYRAADTLALYWIWLGSPGWWGHLSADEQKTIAAWLAAIPSGQLPSGPCEWADLSEIFTLR